jgi:DNA repair photolyase
MNKVTKEAMIEQQDRDAAARHDPSLHDYNPNCPEMEELAEAFAAHRLSGYAQAERDIVTMLEEHAGRAHRVYAKRYLKMAAELVSGFFHVKGKDGQRKQYDHIQSRSSAFAKYMKPTNTGA